jgi:uncharacterized protein (TIGR03437 family)
LGTANTPTLNIPVAEVGGPSISCRETLCGYPAIAITQDSYGAIYVADTTNRVAIHYPALAGDNGASFACAMGCNLGGLAYPAAYLAPGGFVSIYGFNGLPFASSTTIDGVFPVPTTLGGLQVLVNGQASPITSVSSSQINFVVPFEAPTSGTVPVSVVNASTSQVMGSGSMNMNVASPGFFTTNSQGTGQIAALNCNKSPCEDTVNGAADPANPGSTIQFFLTGQGHVANAPPDGQGDCGQVPTGTMPVVLIGGTLAHVSYSGLAPCYVGLWQINVVIPTTPSNLPGFPEGTFPVLVQFQDLVSDSPTNIHNPDVAPTIVISGQ